MARRVIHDSQELEHWVIEGSADNIGEIGIGQLAPKVKKVVGAHQSHRDSLAEGFDGRLHDNGPVSSAIAVTKR
jgi:hypothetical protein